MTLSDWYHDLMPNLIANFINVANPTGAEPVPDAALMNDTQNLQIHVQPGKTYRIRIVNMAAFAAQYFWFEGHSMRVIEVDGITTEATETDMIYITAAQRYSVLVTTKNQTSANFAIVGSMDQVCKTLRKQRCRLISIGPVRHRAGHSQPQCDRLASLRSQARSADAEAG